MKYENEIAMALGRLTEGADRHCHRRDAGKQSGRWGRSRSLVYGQSMTDACIGWDETLPLLRELATAVRSTRSSP